MTNNTTRTLRQGRPPRLLRDTFLLPRGLLGRAGGRLMARNPVQQEELAGLLATLSPREVCEIGSGPGTLANLLAERCPACRIDLVDPSAVMRAQAERRCRAEIKDGRVAIHAGAAEALPFADARFDLVAAVNNVALWPDLDAGLREARRVLRGGGRVVISWHSATAPDKMQRRLALSEAEAETLTRAMGEVFSGVQLRSLTHSAVWEATVPQT